MPPVVAFFDLDHTLLGHNSGVLYAKSAFTQGRISAFYLLRSLMWGFLHWLGKLDVEQVYRRSGQLFRGLDGAEVRAEVGRWFRREVAYRARPGGSAVLARHRALGHRLVLITNSSSYIAEAAVAAWGLDAWLANDILVDQSGLITGEVPQPLCYGSGKVDRAEAWAREHQFDLRDAFFYTDSVSDLPLLERVGSPIVVHPDPSLRRIAVRRAWPVLDWSK